MAKKIEGYIKLQIPAGKANPAPPIGPALGQHGVNIMEFCKAFNAKTQNDDPDMKIPVVITVYADRSFTFETKTPPAADLLQKGVGHSEGFGQAEQGKGRHDLKSTRSKRSPKKKMVDLNTTNLDAAMRTIEGTAKSMGLNSRRIVKDSDMRVSLRHLDTITREGTTRIRSLIPGGKMKRGKKYLAALEKDRAGQEAHA